MEVECCVAGVFFREYPKASGGSALPPAPLYRRPGLPGLASPPETLTRRPRLPLQALVYHAVEPSGSLVDDVKEVLGSLISTPHLHGVSSVVVQVAGSLTIAPCPHPPPPLSDHASTNNSRSSCRRSLPFSQADLMRGLLVSSHNKPEGCEPTSVTVSVSARDGSAYEPWTERSNFANRLAKSYAHRPVRPGWS